MGSFWLNSHTATRNSLILLTGRKTSGYPSNLARSHWKCLQEVEPGSRLIVSANMNTFSLNAVWTSSASSLKVFFCFFVIINNNSNGYLIAPEPVIAISAFNSFTRV